MRWNVGPSALCSQALELSVSEAHQFLLAEAASEVLEKNLKFVIGNIVLAGSEHPNNEFSRCSQAARVNIRLSDVCRWLHCIHRTFHS